MMKKIAMLVMVIMTMVPMMGTMTVSAATETAVEFKETMVEKFGWDDWSPCQREMLDWIFDAGYDNCVVTHVSDIPVTVKCGRRTITKSVVMYFVNEDTGLAKGLRFYMDTDENPVGANWCGVWGDNKRLYQVDIDAAEYVIWF